MLETCNCVEMVYDTIIYLLLSCGVVLTYLLIMSIFVNKNAKKIVMYPYHVIVF